MRSDQCGRMLCSRIKKLYFYLANSEEELLKVVAKLEKQGKDKIESKKDYNNRIEQEKMDQLRRMKLHGQFEELQTIKNQENRGTDSEIEI